MAFLIGGSALFLAATIFLFIEVRFRLHALQATGTIVGSVSRDSQDSNGTTIELSCPKVEFRAEGRIISFVGRTCSDSVAYNSQVAVLYEPSHPERAEIRGIGDYVLAFVIYVMAALFGGAGAVPLWYAARNRQRWTWLLQHGRPIAGRVSSVVRNGAVRIQGWSPFQIVAQWTHPVTGLLHEQRSANLAIDPGSHLPPDGAISVYICDEHPDWFYIDTSFLPRLAAT